jgi:hypothetical protein
MPARAAADMVAARARARAAAQVLAGACGNGPCEGRGSGRRLTWSVGAGGLAPGGGNADGANV